ncbi:MAG TPA: ABC-F family ATP-binding cassette domain-containing protein [Acidimicrobiales bacterium]|nr:ABC-F family ATP-binding cassette domain-containing protein [Acidimicrobiales bacterium]
MAVLVDVAGVSVSRSDRVLFSGLSVTISDGDRLGVVGINGTGKSTLLRVIAGTAEPESGEIRRGRGVRTGLLDQDAPLSPGPVRSAVGEGWEAEAVLERLGMGPFLDRQTTELSGGQAKRVALAAVLARPAELLVLDEPTNHLDLPAISWLEGWLAGFKGGLVLVSHDRHLLDRVTTRMLELDRGKCYVHDSGYAGYLEARAAREERAVEAEAVRRNLARSELAWLRRGAPARTRKPLSRIDAARRLIDGRPEAAAREGSLDLAFQTPRLGSKVIDMDGVAFSYDGRDDRPLLDGVDLSLDPRERLAVVGVNGSGKSTLLELLAGRIRPLRGRVEQGPTVSVGYYTQKAADLNPAARVRDLVAGPHRNPGDPVDNRLMERFWFTGELPWAQVSTLSGGERRRLQLLMVLASRPNVLLLDEPTNDLDLDTLRALEDFLDGWPGAVVVVSHDRVFLDRATDRTVACRDGRVEPVAGGLAAWITGITAPAPRSVTRSTPPDKAAKPARKAEAPGGPARRRSSSTVGFELRRLEKEMSRLTRDRDRLADALATATGHEQLADAGSQLATVQAALEEIEERWLAVAEEAERD